ncbi:MAG TPA: MBL fold metallo-hydrolase [Spirochaetia bacterium]|nr:MBL fold metallo-hydrolase [Spirochaetia bacterium]
MDKSVEWLKEWASRRLQWFGQSAFRIGTDSGRVIFIDPFRVPAGAGPADLILVTHPHGDHFDRGAIAGLSTTATVVVLPSSCAEAGQESLSAGQTATFGTVRVTGIRAYNVRKRFHPQSGNWLGYMIDVDGVRLYHAGDTDAVQEMRDLKPDIALLPIGGMFTMNLGTAAEAVVLLKAGLAIPMHYGMLLGGRGAGRRFSVLVGAGSLVLPRAALRPRK